MKWMILKILAMKAICQKLITQQYSLEFTSLWSRSAAVLRESKNLKIW